MKTLDYSSSKAEEMEFLKKFAKAAGKDTYLSGLFSERLLEWCEGQMRQDLSCDIFTMLIDAVKQDAKADVAKAEAETKEAKQARDEAVREWYAEKQVRVMAEGKAANAESHSAWLRERLEDANSDRGKAWTKVGELINENANLREQLRRTEAVAFDDVIPVA